MVQDMHKPDRRGLDFDGKVSETRSSSRPTACWRSWYAATLRRYLLSSAVQYTTNPLQEKWQPPGSSDEFTRERRGGGAVHAGKVRHGNIHALVECNIIGVSHDPLKSPCFDGDFVSDSPPLLRSDFLLVTIVKGSFLCDPMDSSSSLAVTQIALLVFLCREHVEAHGHFQGVHGHRGQLYRVRGEGLVNSEFGIEPVE